MTEHENVPSPTSETLLPRWMTSYLNLWRSALPRLRNTNQGHDYPSGRRSASLRPLSFYLKHASHATSPTPKLMHPSSPTQTLLMLWMQQYDKLNELDTMEGPLGRLKRSQTEWVQEIEVSHLTKGKPLRGRKSMSTLSSGSRGKEYQQCHSMWALQLCSHSSNSMHRTSNSRNHQYLPLLACLSSPTWNGWVSSQEWWSISTMSFQGCMLSPTTTEKLSSLEEYSSSMEQLKQWKRSKTQETGCRCFKFTWKQLSLSSPTERKNLKITQSKLPLSSWLSPRPITQLLSTMIRQSEPTLEMYRTSSSQTSLSSRISDSTGFTHLDRDSEIQTLEAHLITAQGQAIDQMMTVLSSMMGNALIRPPAANTSIGVQAAEEDTQRRTAVREGTELRCQWPCYTCGLLWGTHDLSGHGDISDTACWGLTTCQYQGYL